MNHDPDGSVAGADRDWTTVPLPELIHYLTVTDHEWIRRELRVIDQELQHLLQEHGAQFPALSHLPHVFAQLCRDLLTHMFHEETELFPVIERYVEAREDGAPIKGSPLNAFGGPLRVMEHEHETVGAAVRLLREFALNYEIPEDCCVAYKLVMERLAHLENRLLQHIYLENNILYPRAAALRARPA